MGNGNYGYTDKNGRLDFTYQANLASYTDNMHITIYGENMTTYEQRGMYANDCNNGNPVLQSNPAITPNIEVANPEGLTNALWVNGQNASGGSVTLPLSTQKMPVELIEGNTASSGNYLPYGGTYNISYVLTNPAGIDTTLSGTTGQIQQNGQDNSVTISTGTKPGTVFITVYYDENANGKDDGNETLINMVPIQVQ